MKFKWLLLLCICCTGMLSKAQVTLDSAGYPSLESGMDSLKKTVVSSSFPSLLPAANGMWDMSAVTDTAPVFFAYRVPCTGYQFADSGDFIFLGYSYQEKEASNIVVSGIFDYQIDVDRTSISIYPLTSGFSDSLIIDSQVSTYSSPRTKIAFPATYSTAWSSAYFGDLHFHLTFLAAGDTMAPGFVRTYTNEKDTVTGWGKMRVKDLAGSPSPYLNVLQVQTRIIHTDSFFINGAPFTPVLLTILGLTQGHKDTIWEQNYYRVGELTPLAQVTFHDAGYTQPYKATTHVQRLSNVSVPDVPYDPAILLYPNPLTGSQVTLSLSAPLEKGSYTLCNILGQVVSAGRLTEVPVQEISLPSVLAPGMYYLRVLSNNRQVAVKVLTLRPN